jgi:hypothetical protein
VDDFNRRNSDANVASLALRVDALERRMETVELEVRTNNREIAANTALTEEIHGNTADMAEMFKATRNGFRMLAGAANFGLKALETGGKVARPLFWMVAVGVAVVAYVKTGTWTMPAWWK